MLVHLSYQDEIDGDHEPSGLKLVPCYIAGFRENTRRVGGW